MFSPETSTLDRAAALRGSGSNSNPRRRQRTASADSLAVRQTQAKRRKRSALAENAFEPPSDGPAPYQNANGTTTTRRTKPGNVNGYPTGGISGGGGHKLSNGVDATISTSTPALVDASLDAGGLAVRSKGSRKEKRNRSGAEDGIELTKTDNYVLTRDRGIPAALQEVLGSEPWQAKLCPDLGFAVALSHTRAIVWKYSHSRSHSYDAGVHVINLPTHSGSGYDYLPTGTLVHDAGAGDLALLVLMAGGKIAYYESVRAAANDAKPGNRGPGTLTGSLSGAFSSEHVEQISEAESDGFLLATNIGRLFHLSVRDSQGRPCISTQHLRMPSAEKVGIFGSIRNAITGGSHDDVASMIPLPGRSRSSKDVIVSTTKGMAQLWNITRHGSKTVEREWNIRDTIEQACKTAVSSLSVQTLKLHDLSPVPTDHDLMIKGEHHVMALASFPEAVSGKYFLVGLTLRDGSTDVDHIHQVSSYNGQDTTSDLSGKKSKPSLIIPEPGHTAFLMFDTKIVLVSLTKLDESPDSQLHAEAQDISDNYEECLYFSRKLPYHTAGCAARLDDDRGDRASCDIMIHGFGQVKLAAWASPMIVRKEDRRARLIRSRLEQVVFYGAMSDNFLDFREEELWKDVTTEDIQRATIAITDGILDSTSSHVPSLMPSMDQQLKMRSQAVFDLNKFAQSWNPSVQDCWRLLWAGEKLAAARAVYTAYNAELAARKDPEKKVLLEEIIDMIHEDDRHLNEPDRGEHDTVRHYLTWDVGRLSTLVVWAQQSIDQLVSEGLLDLNDMADLAPLVTQAADIEITALETAWKFREDHAELFGLGREVIENGIYQRTHADMPSEPWTATYMICERTSRIFDLTKPLVVHLDDADFSQMPFEDDIIGKLVEQAAKLADCAFRCWEEQCCWTEASPDAAIHAKANERRAIYRHARHELLSGLVEMSAHVPAANLAEKYLDMDSLALVTSKIEAQADEWIQEPDPDIQEQGENILAELKERTDKYFELYGRGWAHAFFTRQVEVGGAARMLALLPHRQDYLTEYLRSKKQDDKTYNKLAWINEVRGENNFEDAAKDLWLVQQFEKRLWAKQVGLALTKLSKFAAIETGQGDEKAMLRDIRGCSQRIKFTEVQQRFYEYVRPLLRTAIDGDAELQIAMANLGEYVKGFPTLEENLQSVMHSLVTRRVIGIEDMIESLTIISGYDPLEDDEGFADDRFYWALWLLHSSGLEVNFPDRCALHQRLIWRRVILQDDWVAVNKTESKSDEAVMDEIRRTALYKTLRAGYEDGLLDKHPPLDPRSLHPAGENASQLREVGVHPKKDEAYLARLAKDLAAEDAYLEEIILKGRLEMWWKGIVEAARADVRGERDAHAKLQEYKEKERRAIKENGLQSKGPESQAMMVDGATEEELVTDGVGLVLQNGNGITHHEDDGPSSQIMEETENVLKAAASPKKTKKGGRKTTRSRKKDTEGDLVMAS